MNDKILAITRHKTEKKTVQDYAVTDMEDYRKINNILSNKKSEIKKKILQPLTQQSASVSSFMGCTPQFVFNNHIVYMHGYKQ